jgi:hypothetical protein
MKSGNNIGSQIRKTGVSLNTQSQFPSSVYSFTEKPRGSLAESADPFSRPTVENRVTRFVFFPTSLNKSASHYYSLVLILHCVLGGTYDANDVVSNDEVAIYPRTLSMNKLVLGFFLYRNTQASLRDGNPEVKEAHSFKFTEQPQD